MKANELMVDDWIYNKNIAKPIQVYPMMISQMFRQKPDVTTEDYNIFPIPITPEILEKNGFCPDEFSAYCFSFDDGTIRFSEHQYGWYCHIIRPYQRYDGVCNYVHQLQHALRLCGIEKIIEL